MQHGAHQKSKLTNTAQSFRKEQYDRPEQTSTAELCSVESHNINRKSNTELEELTK